MNLHLLWQSEQAIAVEKPAGIPTQAAAGIESLETCLREQLDRQQAYLAFPHRLDRVVGGIVLVALTKKAARLLSGQFATRKTAKFYTAVVHGRYGGTSAVDAQRDEDQGIARWEDHLRKVPNRSMAEVCAPSTAQAKHAVPIVEAAEEFPTGNQTRLLLRPITGRMHQLRLQAALRGHPIVGDELYRHLLASRGDRSRDETTGDQTTADAASVRAGRILLHASRLDFHDPAGGRRLSVESAPPF
jgi:23S rRNA-/tRNA-specific pseudouridylate synthase